MKFLELDELVHSLQYQIEALEKIPQHDVENLQRLKKEYIQYKKLYDKKLNKQPHKKNNLSHQYFDEF
ncbi:MAG: hypothetical protein LBM95_02780 [Lactobacillales bacterium]|jgi:hypothetical protein|nr:hypothetical protein [Lactobacillales bacterium]